MNQRLSTELNNTALHKSGSQEKDLYLSLHLHWYKDYRRWFLWVAESVPLNNHYNGDFIERVCLLGLDLEKSLVEWP